MREEEKQQLADINFGDFFENEENNKRFKELCNLLKENAKINKTRPLINWLLNDIEYHLHIAELLAQARTDDPCFTMGIVQRSGCIFFWNALEELMRSFSLELYAVNQFVVNKEG